MYTVIFTAEIDKLDELYFETAKAMRERAMRKYGCLAFTSVTEGEKVKLINSVPISYYTTTDEGLIEFSTKIQNAQSENH